MRHHRVGAWVGGGAVASGLFLALFAWCSHRDGQRAEAVFARNLEAATILASPPALADENCAEHENRAVAVERALDALVCSDGDSDCDVGESSRRHFLEGPDTVASVSGDACVSSLIEANEEVLRELDQAMRQRPCIALGPTGLGERERLRWFHPLLCLNRLLALRTALSLSDGDRVATLESYRSFVLSLEIHLRNPLDVAQLARAHMLERRLLLLRRILANGWLDEAALELEAESLAFEERYTPRLEALRAMLHWQGEVAGFAYEQLGKEPSLDDRIAWTLHRYVCNDENLTEHAELVSALEESMERAHNQESWGADAILAPLDALAARLAAEEREAGVAWPSCESFFRGAWQMAEPNVKHPLGKLSEERLDLRRTRLLIAAERYRVKHGRVPDTVDDLVPEFLPSPPGDPSTGAPLPIE